MSCETPPLEQARAEADLVFAGRVVDPGYILAYGKITGKVHFEVLALYKGPVGKTVRVDMYSRGFCGGYPLQPVGEEFLVFAYNDEDWLPGPNYRVSICSRSGSDVAAPALEAREPVRREMRGKMAR